MKPTILRVIVCGATLVLTLTAWPTAAAASQQATPTPIPAVAPSAPMAPHYGSVDVGGREMTFYCTGQGRPTVILEAGGGDSAATWGLVQSGGDRDYRVCSYDRANLGRSDPAPKPRTFQDMSSDLHAMLLNAGIAGPYILVGHSMGGMLVRVFRDQYPDEVVGLVLVESAHPDMGPRLLAALPPQSLLESKAMRTWRRYLTYVGTSEGRQSQDLEGADLLAGNELVRATKPLGALPLVVISRSPDSSGFPHMPDLPVETSASLSQIWQDMQTELVALSSNATRVIAGHAGHMIPTEEPEPVIEAIRTLVGEARSRTGYKVAAALAEGSGAAQHTPVILRTVDRQETKDGQVSFHKDVFFMDAAGDASILVNKVADASIAPTLTLLDDLIEASAAEQQGDALVTTSWHCGTPREPYWIVFEYRVLDQAGNMSGPVTLTATCPAAKESISPFLVAGVGGGVALLALGGWLLLRYRRVRRAVALPA